MMAATWAQNIDDAYNNCFTRRVKSRSHDSYGNTVDLKLDITALQRFMLFYLQRNNALLVRELRDGNGHVQLDTMEHLRKRLYKYCNRPSLLPKSPH